MLAGFLFPALAAAAPNTAPTFLVGDGIVTTAIGASASSQSVAMQADGKILVAGTGDFNFALVRYNTDGSLDANFGTAGIVTTAIGSAYGYSVAMQTDSKILVAGSSYNHNYSWDCSLVRYTTNGSLDTSFGSGGMVTTAGYSGQSAAMQADGKILVAGSSDGNVNSAIARYNADGSLDIRFNLRNTLNATPTFTEGGSAVILSSIASIYDAELSANHYSGATVTLARQGGASPDDVFSSGGALGTLTEGAVLSLSGTIIGTVSQNSGGTLALLFNSNATQARVDQALSSIAYANTSRSPPAQVVIDWTFSDGNSGAQGSGGALTTTGSTTVTLIGVNDAPTASDATLTMAANSSYTLQAGDFGFLDAEDGTALTAVRIDTLPAAGSLRYSGAAMVAGLDVSAAELAAGNLTFTSTSTASGANYASFRFSVKDSGGSYSGNGYYSGGNTLTFSIGSCTHTLSSSSQTASAAGLAGNLGVTANTGCPWTATSNASWITVTSGASGSGNGTVVYSVVANTSSSTRTGTLAIGGQTFIVTQNGTAAAAAYANQVQAMYIAYFGRPADPGGLVNFEAGLLAAGAPTNIQDLLAAYSTNATIKSMVDGFGTSAESNRLYTGDTMAFVTAVFNSVLNRPPLTAGKDFWVLAIDSGMLTKGNAALSIMAGALANTSTQGLIDAALVNNKILIGSNFTSALATTAQVSAYGGQTAAATVRAMLATVNNSTDSAAFQATITSTVAQLVVAAP